MIGLLSGALALAAQGCGAGESTDPSGSGGSQTGSGGGSSTGAGGSTASGGATGAGGTKSTVGTGGSGGTSPTGGSTGTAGASGAGGSKATGGTSGTGGATGTGGTRATGGTTGTGGATATGGSTGSGGTSATGGATASCGSTTRNENPFGCNFAWGTNNPGGSLASYSYLQFMSDWVGSEIQANGNITSCSGCSWLTGKVASTNLIPVYYAYVIGYLGQYNGFPDGNTAAGAASLTTGGTYIIRKYRSQIIAAYTYYAKQTYAAWPTKPLLWLLEGDFVQYTDSTQVNYPNATASNPGTAGATDALSYAELGQLAADITCAIKANMPNAIVAINHSTWNDDATTNSFWGAMANVNYDMAWTSGVANASGYFSAGTIANPYNINTASYAYLHSLTGRTIFVDTSFGASSMDDTWSDSPAATINARIADGVIAANVTTSPVPSIYPSAVMSLEPSLGSTCP
ncbi:MAG TPA: hypothetical protein VH853_02045 [Polyangia bacterium]|nr:hypothetical protein [Polyangia bacterium]